MSQELTIQFRSDLAIGADLAIHLQLIRKLAEVLGRYDETLGPERWLLARGGMEESCRYPVFEASSPASAALAVLRETMKGERVLKSFVIWNGEIEGTNGASITYRFDNEMGAPSYLDLSMKTGGSPSRLQKWEDARDIVTAAISLCAPLYVSVSDVMNYDPVFKDRPGVGWMLYLPRILTVQQVPEARALVPVKNGDKKQVGTIIVSVTEEPFSANNPEHVKIANAIEIRLVDQDLLPRFVDM
jgi:hypothetical protein